MGQLLRKDIVFLWVLGFAVLFMSVSQPENVDVRVIVWNFAFILLLSSSVLWFMSELIDWVLGQSSGRIKEINVNGLTRNGLMAVVEKQGHTIKSDLSMLSDEDLAALVIAGNNGDFANSSASVSLWNVIVRLFKVFIKFISVLKGFLVKMHGLVSMSKSDRKDKIDKIVVDLKDEINRQE